MFWKKEKDTVSVVSLGEEDVQRESIGTSTKDKNQYNQDEIYSLSSSQEKQPDQSETVEHQLKQGLKSRHVQLIALGGAIGTGLFVGTSSTLHTCGPAGLFISYCIISTVIYPIMQAIGEMVCYLPGTGNESAGSAAHLVNKYLDESLGFATAWNYYYCYVILVAAECTAASGVVEYWTERVPKAAWITIFLFMVVFLNFAAVKFYGESEFWFASIKILCIVGLIMLSFILFWGGGPNRDRLGFRFWQHPGGFAHHIRGGSFGSFLDIYTGIIKGGFAFILGPELVAMTSAEVEDQRRNIAKASRRFVWRLMFFYILGALSISVIVAWNDPALTNALSQGKPGAGSSPFVIGIQNAGIHGLPHIINACILTSAWSAGNAFMFASARSLLNMAHHGQAPAIFGKVNRWGVPYVAVAFSSAICCLAYLNCSSSTKDVFNWFSNISVISGFIGWICISVAYIRFHKAIIFHGMFSRLPYHTWGMPYLIYWSLTIISIVTLTNGYQVFIPKYWDAKDFVAAYITLPIFLVLWIGHRVWRRKIFTLKWWKSLEEIDVITGVDVIEEITRECDEKRIEPTTWHEKILDAIL